MTPADADTTPLTGQLREAEVRALHHRVLRVVGAPIMLTLGASTSIGIATMEMPQPTDPWLWAAAACSALPLMAYLPLGLGYMGRLAPVFMGPLLLGLLMLCQTGPTMVPGLLFINGCTVVAAFTGTRNGLFALGLSGVAWWLVGWGHSTGAIEPSWLMLNREDHLSSWIWNGLVLLPHTLGSILAMRFFQSLTYEAIEVEQGLSVQLREEMDRRQKAEAAHSEAAHAAARAREAQALGQLASGVAHDFNNALMVLMVTAELSEMGDTSPEGLVVAARLKANALQAAQLNRSLLAMSRPVQPRVVQLDLNRVMQETLAVVQPLMPPHVQIQTVLSSDTPPILGEPTRVGQLLVIAALQARDLLPEGGTLHVVTEPLDGDAHLRFIIEGATEDRDGLFGLASEAPRPPDLTAFEQILADLGGRLNNRPDQSLSGLGACLVLPASEAIEPQTPTTPTRKSQRSLRVLVAEDEAPVRRLIARSLAEAGMTVLEAADGQEALEIFQKAPRLIDLICTDGRMPRLDGPGLVEAVREVRPEVPIIVCSAFVQSDRLQVRLDQDDIHFLAKPFEQAELVEQIHRITTASPAPQSPGEMV